MEKQEEVSKKILNYLRRNPDAGDTLEGIAEWWLCCENIEASVDEVSSALQSLIKKGIVSKTEIGSGNPVYKICKKD
ncbi:MAG: hypothetical protein ACE5KZ_02795 [Candidatus Scalinduaceae bacterium]